MKVRFISSIAEHTGLSELDIDGCTNVGELLSKLCSVYGDNFKNVVYSGIEQDIGVIITVNGRHIALSGGLNTELHNSDEISFFPMIIGG